MGTGEPEGATRGRWPQKESTWKKICVRTVSSIRWRSGVYFAGEMLVWAISNSASDCANDNNQSFDFKFVQRRCIVDFRVESGDAGPPLGRRAPH